MAARRVVSLSLGSLAPRARLVRAQQQQQRTAVSTTSGAILPKPKKVNGVRSGPDHDGRGSVPVRRDDDQQELRGSAGGTRYIRTRG
ncbi:uncharacterized protein LOC125248539 isoform X2 [Megalobrama amblycephala]|uniref:uncharacterized protein LOC125248539 isoform X2 n=1 Tax=Megalobrama amblycephala TaxID=75352 RepID=UPI0020140BB6|nr:uncharacterized protein LOC125248539 isoform X2 [Megalobrama amblycephala]